ncbi:MAG: phosphatidylinositol-specific phospholipase C1-like protein [Acidimicrobiales bacterium]|nr:phosphatidylinositol-specific phospholipase C1-like protein [Acidimicrobiales bacterium]
MPRARRIGAVLAAAAAVASLGMAAVPGLSAQAQDTGLPGDDIRLNEIQVVGSHNSYHLMPSQAELDLRRSVIGAAEDRMEYRHLPLPDQFQEQKVRQIELDVFVDKEGGRYAHPLLRSAAGVTAPLDPVMSEPGLKVFHIQDVDYESTCLTLEACLRAVKGWSDAHPTHVPIAILLELKDTPLELGDLPFVVPEPFDATAMNEVDSVIRSVFPADQVITPDDVRGSHATLPEALADTGWPTLGQSRGKVMFLMDNGGGYRDTYLAGASNLAGRMMFTNADPGDDDAAFIKRNDPTDPSIPDLVRDGYVVRTRADSDTLEARDNDTSQRDAALASGAQWVSTDFPVPNFGVGFETDYFVEIPGGTVARCNPVNAPPDCVSADLDQPGVPTTPTTSTSAATTSTVGTDQDGTGVQGAAGASPLSGSPNYTG